MCSFGGMCLGVLTAIGGWAIGGLAIGGGAVGGIATGGGAVGIVAKGGGAFGVYAQGGGAGGKYIINKSGRQDPEALQVFGDFDWLLGPVGSFSGVQLTLAYAVGVVAAFGFVIGILAIIAHRRTDR